MAEPFFSQTDGGALLALLERTALRDAALITVSAARRVENCSRHAAGLTGLRPLDPVDPILSAAALEALRDCIARQSARSVWEELDGVEYRLELIPHRQGALLAFLRDDRAVYDGSLRVLHTKGLTYLGGLMACADEVADPALAARLRLQCLRMQRMLAHSDFLHDPPLTEQLRLRHCDLADLCRETAGQTAAYCGRRITLQLPDGCEMLLDRHLVETALYNLLTNAVQATPDGGDITLSLRCDGELATVTVADRGAGLDAALFEGLLSGWKRTAPLEDYLALVRQGTTPGLGLPLVQRVAQLHGGTLLLSPREGGGSELHFSLARLPDALADLHAYAPMILDEGCPVAQFELCCLNQPPLA